MKLTREERSRILAGDHSALKRDREPDVEEGEGSVLIWSRKRTVITDKSTGATLTYPRRKLAWVTFEKPVRHKNGGWRIALTFHDERVRPRFLSPSAAPTSEPTLNDEAAKGYRSSAVGAIDTLEAVDDQDLARQAVESRERWAAHREEMAAEDEARRQMRAVREQLKLAVRTLGGEAGQALLAAIRRQIQEALDGHRV